MGDSVTLLVAPPVISIVRPDALAAPGPRHGMACWGSGQLPVGCLGGLDPEPLVAVLVHACRLKLGLFCHLLKYMMMDPNIYRILN